MNKLVNKAQNVFVEGRQILDAFLIANQIIDSIDKIKDSNILCKLDIEKSYDHLNWNFILKVLEKMRFGSKWVKWIKWSITTVAPRDFLIVQEGSNKWVPSLPTYLFLEWRPYPYQIKPLKEFLSQTIDSRGVMARKSSLATYSFMMILYILQGFRGTIISSRLNFSLV